MPSTLSCAKMAEVLCEYVDEDLPASERTAVEAHLRHCSACRSEEKRIRAVGGLLAGSREAGRPGRDFAAETSKRLREVAPRLRNVREEEEDEAELVGAGSSGLERMGALPWWGISVALHVLIVLLLGLVTMSIGTLPQEESVIVLTSLEKNIIPKAEEQKEEKPTARDVFNNPKDTPPTDPTATVQSNIVVPPDILAKAELGDHFETINLDRPDTQSAFGNPEARMFHSEAGNDEPEGGGGMGGQSLLDDLIGVGGSASPGTGGGWGGGNGTGVGIGTGSGKGSFGQRGGGGRRLMVMRHGGNKATESAVDKALEWLARHQDADGSWKVTATEGANANWDPGVTGLATLAFLGAGHSLKVGKYKDNVRRAVAWIISQQDPNGAIGNRAQWLNHGGCGYHHPICGMALAEALAMSGKRSEDSWEDLQNKPAIGLKEAAQKALDYTCEIHQVGEGSEKYGWRYTAKDKEGDLSNVGWFVMHLKSGKVAGLHVNPASFDGATKYLDHVQVDKVNVKADPNASFDEGGHRYEYQKGRGPTPNNTSQGVLCRLFMGIKPEEVAGAVRWLMQVEPLQWQASLGKGVSNHSFPMYFMYYTTLGAFQCGGDIWKEWNEGMKRLLLTNQRVGGDQDGSWDPLGGHEKQAGRAYTTALGAMCLEVYYRYLPMYRN